MNDTPVTLDDIAVLTVLADGIIPPDHRDAGAACVHAGPGIAERMRRSVFGFIYLDGLATTRRLATQAFARPITTLSTDEVHHLLTLVREHAPYFFRLVRADVCALYLSDAGVWQRIGFPGPSAALGGHPDFAIQPLRRA